MVETGGMKKPNCVIVFSNNIHIPTEFRLGGKHITHSLIRA